jgi:hypothetical protein
MYYLALEISTCYRIHAEELGYDMTRKMYVKTDSKAVV